MSIKKKAAQVRKVGAQNSDQDSILAHINPKEAGLLQMYGGSGRPDPNTGLPHFDEAGGDGGAFGGGDGFGNGFGGGFGNGMGGMSGGEGAGFGGLGGFGNGEGGDTGTGDNFSSALNGDLGFNSGLGMEGFGAGLGTGISSGLGDYSTNTSDQTVSPWARALKGIMGLVPGTQLGKAAIGMGTNLASPNPSAASAIGNAGLGMAAGAIGGPVGMGLGAIGGALGWGNAIGNALGKGNPAGNGTSNGAMGSGGDLGSIASGLYGMYKGNQADKQASTLANMYGQNSPYAAAMRQQLDRRDAAAGRRSQYGPREVELQAALANQYGRNAPTMMAMQNRADMIRGQGMAMLARGIKPSLANMFSSGSSWAPAQSSQTLGSLYSGSGYGDNGWSAGSNDGFYSDPMMGP